MAQRRKQILAVEDHDLLLDAVRRILEAEGYEVLTASDGIEALEKLQTSTPDLIVADISMPRMDGYTFYQKVRENPAWVAIPFVFLTARAEREDRLRGKALGAEDYLTKPFDPQELIVVVRARIGRAEAIRESQASEYDQLRQQILTLLSHELRTPLTSVYGYTELALEEAATLPESEFKQFLQGVKNGADRLARLVEDALTVVRLESGDLQQEIAALSEIRQDLPQIVERAVALFKTEADEKNIVLDIDLPAVLPPVRVQEQLLIDALGRLLDNAIKFSRREVKRVRVSACLSEDNRYVEISIRDWGVGIPQASLRHLFKPFSQINRQRYEQQGAGLGLAIALGIIQAMGGDITVSSSVEGPDAGTTFVVRLPIASEQ